MHMINDNCKQIYLNHKVLMHSKSAEISSAQRRKQNQTNCDIHMYILCSKPVSIKQNA